MACAAASKVKAALPLIRVSLLNRAGANLARDQKLLFAPAPLLDRLGFNQLLTNVECYRPQAPVTAADLLDQKFGSFSIQDMQLRPSKEASGGNKCGSNMDDDDDEEYDDDDDDFDSGDEDIDFDSDDADFEGEKEDDDDVPKKKKK